MDIQAYFEEWSRLPGETVRMAISTERKEVRATLEKITRGPTAADASDGNHAFGMAVPGLDIVIPGIKQETAIGSYADLPLGLAAASSEFSVHLWFRSSAPDWDKLQAILSCGCAGEPAGFTVGLLNKRLVAGRPGDLHQLDLPVDANVWHSLVLAVEGVVDENKVTIDIAQAGGMPATDPRRIRAVEFPGACLSVDMLRLGAQAVSQNGSAVSGFNGKIESPSYFGRALSESERGAAHAEAAGATQADRAWKVAEDFSSRQIVERKGLAPPAIIHNGAERGVTGHNWTGASDSFVEAPDQYGAIYFHSDEMVDANWDYNLEFALPNDLASGIYAVVLKADGHEDRYPLFVRSRNGKEADVLFIVPTNTYLAYANDRFAGADLSGIMSHDKIVSADEQYLNEHPEFGLSCYDVHSDGSPVRYSSRRRPLVNVRPHYPNWLTGSFRHFAVDLFIVEWLERSGFTYHVATDEDVHLAGKDLLSRHNVVVTGSHPEYWTNKALAGLDNYLKTGGRLMYLGGNGFYWVTTHDPERPWIIEVRRDNSGIRAWDAPPGERTHVHTGEPGGLWRYRGRAPNKMCGIAFATEGFSKAQPYKRTPASYDERYKSFFEGIDDDVIGDFGYILGGAAGDECDRFDRRLGSPPQTMVLASATGFGPEYLLVNEDVNLPLPKQDGTTRPDMVRADIVHFPIFGGGEVFSVGSIAFAGAIAWNGFDNNAARLVNNVLKRFVKG